MRNMRKICVFISVVLIVAGLVCALTIGMGTSAQFDGARRYYASVSSDVDVTAIDTVAMSRTLSAAAGKEVDAQFATNYSTGGIQLNILSTPATYEINADKLVAALGADYADLGIESLSVEVTEPTYGNAAIVALAVLLAVLLIVGLIAAIVTVGGALSWKVALLALHDLLLAFSLFVLSRTGSFAGLAAVLLATLALSLLLNIRRMAELDREMARHKTADDAIAAVSYNRGAAVDYAVIGILFCAAMVVTSIVSGFAVLSVIGVCGLIAILCSLYSSAVLAVGFWASSQK